MCVGAQRQDGEWRQEGGGAGLQRGTRHVLYPCVAPATGLRRDRIHGEFIICLLGLGLPKKLSLS